MRNKIAALAVTALLAGGALATASSASAAPLRPQASSWDHVWTTSDSGHGGTISVKEHGDVIKLCDTHADGYAPRAYVAYYTSAGDEVLYPMIASGGNGSCTENSASAGQDLPENTEIYVDIWLGPNYAYETDHLYLNDH